MGSKIVIPTSAARFIDNGAGPFVEYQTRSYPTAQGGNAALGRDILFAFSRPYNFFFVASQFNGAPGAIMVHLWPLTYPVVDPVNPLLTSIVPTGGDKWLPLIDGQVNSGAGEVNFNGRYFRLKNAIQKFYVDWDHPNGGPQILTFGGSNDIEAWNFDRI